MAAAERRRLESELEEVLDELSTLQEKEVKEEQQLQLLQYCNHKLQSELDQAKGQLDRLEVTCQLWSLQGPSRPLKWLNINAVNFM